MKRLEYRYIDYGSSKGCLCLSRIIFFPNVVWLPLPSLFTSHSFKPISWCHPQSAYVFPPQFAGLPASNLWKCHNHAHNCAFLICQAFVASVKLRVMIIVTTCIFSLTEYIDQGFQEKYNFGEIHVEICKGTFQVSSQDYRGETPQCLSECKRTIRSSMSLPQENRSYRMRRIKGAALLQSKRPESSLRSYQCESELEVSRNYSPMSKKNDSKRTSHCSRLEIFINEHTSFPFTFHPGCKPVS